MAAKGIGHVVSSEHADWQDRAHFFALAAQLMRRILVDAARARNAKKRGETNIFVADWVP